MNTFRSPLYDRPIVRTRRRGDKEDLTGKSEELYAAGEEETPAAPQRLLARVGAIEETLGQNRV